MTLTRQQSQVTILLIAAFALRFAVVCHALYAKSGATPLPDEREYFELATHLHDGTGFWFYDARFDQDIRAYRTPGYPLFLALFHNDPRDILIVQAFVDTSTCLAVYLLARRWLNRRASLVAAVFVAANPFLIFFSATFLSETLFTSLLAWGLFVTSGASWGRLLFGALLLALAAMVRPSAILLPVFAAAFAPFVVGPHPSRPPTYRDRGMRTVIAAVVTFAAFLPWAYRNSRVVGSWVWTTTNSGITLYDGFHAGATGASDQSFLKSLPELSTMSEVDRSRELSRRARLFVVEHPADVVRLTVAKLARTWSPFPLSKEYGGSSKYVAAGLLYACPLFLLTIAGLLSGKLPVPAKMFLLLPALYLTVAHAASVGSLRYRVPADVTMAVVAASVFQPRRDAETNARQLDGTNAV